MQEEVNEKTISLCIKGGKITAKILKAALIKLLAEMDKKKKQQEKGKGQCKRTGKQSIKSLQKSGAQITNIVVTDNNIKSFDRVARKCGVDYAFYKTNDGKHLLLFREQQKDAVTACFEDYSRLVLKQGRTRRVPVLERLKQARERVRRQPVRERTKERDYEDR